MQHPFTQSRSLRLAVGLLVLMGGLHSGGCARRAPIAQILDIPRLADQSPEVVERIVGKPSLISDNAGPEDPEKGQIRMYDLPGLSGLQVTYDDGKANVFAAFLKEDDRAPEETLRAFGLESLPLYDTDEAAYRWHDVAVNGVLLSSVTVARKIDCSAVVKVHPTP